MLGFLPARIKTALSYLNYNFLYELRVRAGKPLRVNYNGTYVYLGAHGVAEDAGRAIIPTSLEIEDALFAACGYSVYAVENQLKNGFVTGSEGERIGIAGTFVYDHNGVHSVHSVSSLCIRVPHAVVGCGESLYQRIFAVGIKSMLLLSPPGDGKTTLLRDVTRLVCQKTCLNVLVSDERGELSAGELGDTCDVVRFADKLTVFTQGIRAMKPDLIVTDELLPQDYAAVRRAVESGIKVFASAHLTRYEDVPDKLFERYVVLNGLGKIEKIYGENGEDVD